MTTLTAGQAVESGVADKHGPLPEAVDPVELEIIIGDEFQNGISSEEFMKKLDQLGDFGRIYMLLLLTPDEEIKEKYPDVAKAMELL